MIFFMIFLMILKISYHKIKVSTGGVETRWLGWQFLNGWSDLRSIFFRLSRSDIPFSPFFPTFFQIGQGFPRLCRVGHPIIMGLSQYGWPIWDRTSLIFWDRTSLFFFFSYFCWDRTRFYTSPDRCDPEYRCFTRQFPPDLRLDNEVRSQKKWKN